VRKLPTALLAAVVALIVAVTPGAGAAPTPIPEHFCQKVVLSHGQGYGVDGSGVRCNFMLFWTDRFLDHGGEPRGWNCVDLGDGGGCDKRRSKAFFEYYALD
jgi:hypothetical protein